MEYFTILGIPITASEEDIRKAYRRLALQFHPDRCPGDPDAVQKFIKIQEAYDNLIDPSKRHVLVMKYRPKPAKKPKPKETNVKQTAPMKVWHKTAQVDLWGDSKRKDEFIDRQQYMDDETPELR